MTIGAVVLAAGASRRMGETNKLLLPFGARPMIAHVVRTVLASGVRTCVVVTGHEADAVTEAVAGLATVAHNPDWRGGMASSIRTGVNALPTDTTAAVIVLGDMPRLGAAHLDALIAAFDPDDAGICVPMFDGRRGNPVLWAASYFDELRALQGDVGAKHLLKAYASRVCRVDMPDNATLVDVDTPDEYQSV